MFYYKLLSPFLVESFAGLSSKSAPLLWGPRFGVKQEPSEVDNLHEQDEEDHDEENSAGDDEFIDELEVVPILLVVHGVSGRIANSTRAMRNVLREGGANPV